MSWLETKQVYFLEFDVYDLGQAMRVVSPEVLNLASISFLPHRISPALHLLPSIFYWS